MPKYMHRFFQKHAPTLYIKWQVKLMYKFALKRFSYINTRTSILDAHIAFVNCVQEMKDKYHVPTETASIVAESCILGKMEGRF